MDSRLFPAPLAPTPETRLQRINHKYEQLFKHDPNALRAAIPVDDIWRFFVEAKVQVNGRGFIRHPNYASHYADRLHLTIDECFNEQKKQVEDSVINLIKDKPLKYYGSRLHLMQKYGKLTTPCVLITTDLHESSLDEWLADGYRNKLTLKDITLLDKGWSTFERDEPNYFKSLYRAFNELFHIDSSLNLMTVIPTLHQLATTGVKLSSTVKPGVFREWYDSFGSFGLTKENMTLTGARYIFEKNKKYTNFNICVSNHPYNGHIGGCKKLTADELFRALQEMDTYDWVQLRSLCDEQDYILNELKILIEAYQTAIATAQNDVDKIKAIVIFVIDCEQLHPFWDANCRTLVMLLLNFLLIKNSFPLTLLENPNWFDAHSPDELVDVVIDGMQNVFELIETKKVFGITTESIIADYKLVNHPEAQHALALHKELNKIEADNRAPQKCYNLHH